MPLNKSKVQDRFIWEEDARFSLALCECHGLCIEGLTPVQPVQQWAHDVEEGKNFAIRALGVGTEGHPTVSSHILIGSLLMIVARLKTMGALKGPGDARRAIFALLDAFDVVDGESGTYTKCVRDIVAVFNAMVADATSLVGIPKKPGDAGNLH